MAFRRKSHDDGWLILPMTLRVFEQVSLDLFGDMRIGDGPEQGGAFV
jgi:hypothetical protein